MEMLEIFLMTIINTADFNAISKDITKKKLENIIYDIDAKIVLKY